MIMGGVRVMGLRAVCSVLKPPYPPITLLSVPPPKALKPESVCERKPFVCCSSRRDLNLSIVSLPVAVALPDTVLRAEAQELELLQRYTDSVEGFTLLRPSSWVEVDKGGATVLFEEENKRINNVGVVVLPVRLESLEQFGSPQFVADKVIQAEKRKESTKDVELIGCAERSSEGGLQVYEFEYIVDSTRGGMKRIFSAAFVNSKKLYLLNIAHVDTPESPLDSQTRTLLEQVLHSFDAAPLA